MAEIKNPNQHGGGQDSKTVLMFTSLFLLIFLGLQFFKQQHKTPAPAKPAQHTSSQSAALSSTPASTPASTASGAKASTPPPAAAVPPTPVAPDAKAVQAASESTTTVENELYRITFSNRGGQVTSWILKKYKNDDGKPLDLVNQDAAKKYGYPLSLFAYDASLRSRLNSVLYKPSATGTMSAPGTLSFDYSAGGLTVHKTFKFDASYVIHAQVSVTQNGAPVKALLAWPAGFGDQETLPQYANATVDTWQNGKSDQVSAKKVKGGDTLHGPYDWAGVSDLYFAAIFLPDKPSSADLVTLHDTVNVPKNRQHPNPDEVDHTSVLGAAIGNTAGPLSVRLFAGPKSLDVLSSIHAVNDGPNLEKVVSFGWWGLIAKPLFYALRWLHTNMVSNWGWAILVLTVVLNLAMLPTRFQMMKSSVKMQRIQPQMDAIKQKYAKYKSTDPRKQEMQKEIFALQKREGVNMFGSCLPMLIQWPLLYGWYRMLENVIELRHAHWLWLPDLSAPDPLHILPIFFIISMFLVQWLTPSPGVDPKQQKMMAFTMPAIFGFMTWNIGSGVALYWASSNVIGILQQMAINKTSLGREMREIAARRAAKKHPGKVIAGRR